MPLTDTSVNTWTSMTDLTSVSSLDVKNFRVSLTQEVYSAISEKYTRCTVEQRKRSTVQNLTASEILGLDSREKKIYQNIFDEFIAGQLTVLRWASQLKHKMDWII
jgi:hypothetical protein